MKMDGDKQKEKRDLTPTNDDENVPAWSEGKFELIPADVHEVKFVGFRNEHHDTYGHRLNLIFDTEEIVTSNDEPFRISTWAGATFSARGKIRPMLTAMGVDVDALDRSQFKLSAYVGGRLRITVNHEKKQGDDGPYDVAIISGFLPSKLGKRQPWESKDREKVGAGASRRRVVEDDDDD